MEEYAVEAAGALLAHAIFVIAREARILTQLAQNTEIGADAIRRVHRARQLLESSGQVPLSVEDAAESVGWSGDHLRRMFRQVLGASPSQVQLAARLGHAQALLRDEALPIAEVARQCGFDDASHFARVFKKETGLTPRQYERLAKKL